MVSVDGSYDNRGYHATHGISFIYEAFTGIAFDCNNLEKCFGTKEDNKECKKVKRHEEKSTEK